MAPKEVASDVFHLSLNFANVYFIGRPGGAWTLVDTATPGHAQRIYEAAKQIYGPDARPEAILLTHGHRDHSGSAADLANFWDVPIVAHGLELPYLTGKSKYPPPDPTVGGFMALYGRFVPAWSCDFRDRIRTLEPGVEAPGLSGWEWHHTPGHSPGHVVLFRRTDATLIAGDAITTVNLDSFFAVAMQRQRVCGPPNPFTPDWPRAHESVRRIAELRPVTIATGHGIPMSGGKAVQQLAELAMNLPIPAHGRYVQEPARMDENGVVFLPPAPPDNLPAAAMLVGAAAAAGTMFAVAARRRKRTDRTTEPVA